jgi:sulfatase maturation enzyme AslB (radical SAM superfamily)
MEVVRLTNLGNLTLGSMLDLESIYKENSSLRRGRLSKLWDSEDQMNLFHHLFGIYFAKDQESIVIKDADSYLLLKKISKHSRFAKAHKINYDLKRFLDLGLIRTVQDARPIEETIQDIKKDEYTNPIKYLNRLYLELTELCNLNCGHCYRGGSREEYGLSIEEIKKTLEPLLRAGIRSMAITGGEATLRRDDLFHILDYVSPFLVVEGISEGKKPDLPIGILTNGYFENQREFVKKVKTYGNVSIQASLDSFEEEKTDRNRGKKGVFAKVKSLAQICKEEEVCLYLSMLSGCEFSDYDRLKTYQFTEEEKENMEFFGGKVHRIGISGITILGNAAQQNFEHLKLKSTNNYFGSLSHSKKHHDGWCKGFTRPTQLNIRPNGNVGTCDNAYGFPEESGNLKSTSMIEILNGIQNTRIYQMFKDGSIEQYQHELDKSLFPKTFIGSCEVVTLTAAYGLTKERLMRQGVENPVQMANEEVARTYKFIN